MPDILISGFRSSELTAGAAQALENCENIILHTARCPLAVWLQEKGKAFRSLDRLYDEAEDFDTHIKLVQDELEKQASGLFCVMSVWDEAARAYARRHPAVKVLGGGSFAPLEVRSAGRICSSSAQDIRGAALPALASVLVSEIDSREIAGEVKLVLLDAYGDEADMFFMDPEGQVIHLACENLDRLKHYDHRCACLVNPPAEPFRHDMESLEKLAKQTCAPGEEMPCENTLPLAKSLADVIKYCLACRRHGYDPAWDIFYRAAEIIKKENRK